MRLCAVLRGVERLWEALGGFIDFGWLCHALGGFGFGRLWEAFEKPWGALGGCGSIVCLSPRLWEALESFDSLWEPLGRVGRLWEALEGFGMLRKALGGFGRLWKAWEGFGRLLDVLGCFGRLAAWLWSNGCFGRFWRL